MWKEQSTMYNFSQCFKNSFKCSTIWKVSQIIVYESRGHSLTACKIVVGIWKGGNRSRESWTKLRCRNNKILIKLLLQITSNAWSPIPPPIQTLVPELSNYQIMLVGDLGGIENKINSSTVWDFSWHLGWSRHFYFLQFQ